MSDTSLSLIIVNDGSSQGIDKKDIDQLKENIPSLTWIDQQPNQGKGAALRKGMKTSTAEHVVFTDIDFPYTFESTLGLCKAVISGESDIVVGQRKARYYEKTPWQREFISKLLKVFNKYILRIPVTDTQCGLKGFNKKGLEIFNTTTVNRYLFDLEFLILAGSRKHQLKIAPLEVELRDEVTFSKLNSNILLTEGWNVLRILVKKWFS